MAALETTNAGEEGNRASAPSTEDSTKDSPAETIQCAGCGKEASTLACPTCVNLQVTPLAHFCTQTCFKASWATHKKVHKQWKIKAAKAAEASAPPAWSRSYSFTGTLRPAAYGPQRTIPDHIRKPDYAVTSIPESERLDRRNNSSIRVYTPENIIGIREACRIGRLALDAVGKAIRVGVTTDELDRVCHEVHVANNAYPSPLNYFKFPKSVCTSVNEVICHGIPDLRPLQDGDIVNIDVSTYIGGYHGDLNETFLVGQVDQAGRDLVRTAFDCLAAALANVRPGAMYRDLGKVISKSANAKNCSVVKTYCGHGIGELFHTAPNVPHYAKNKAKGVMQPGHIFTVEPMINEDSWRDQLWPDNWTAVTEDGGRSAQFEHTVVVTKITDENPKGYEILTMREGEPVMCWNDEIQQR
uniref:Methionine aminopeptidase n=1 Tax=Octactis speculum TaxID=3111310 RepID=A0A7S2D184_9STRA|mmetsp:Transcript_4148/g.4861  ORF Transcript_4148/g.4861 Transcript_4148/m.4861 type:complete len:414 (+) Transcript_4148:34-1275(+)|eukprot:CAMPEP_0185769232 /NCGR_PEP_ID=MMETSP1174-20130828/53458_1 /TAXON_ID=35687 /ORGANISM="Dictyocha speculum, Strain CCMP1381" /LENGTH=413 /DNA_ID=CAMNT_0028454221 /DNA_START=33 /DNA_END=1274 /DNA_ORIENTATION=-